MTFVEYVLLEDGQTLWPKHIIIIIIIIIINCSSIVIRWQ